MPWLRLYVRSLSTVSNKPKTMLFAFLHIVDVGAAARDELRRQGRGDQIRQDAARIGEEDESKDVSPLRAAMAFLYAWPDLEGGSNKPYAYRRSKSRQLAIPHN